MMSGPTSANFTNTTIPKEQTMRTTTKITARWTTIATVGYAGGVSQKIRTLPLRAVCATYRHVVHATAG